jgi:hypothetical protein
VAGNGYPGLRYALNQDGQIVQHGFKPEDYLTDVAAADAVRFIKQKSDQPFFIEVATFARTGRTRRRRATPTPFRACAPREARPITRRPTPRLRIGWPGSGRSTRRTWAASTVIFASEPSPCLRLTR